MLATNRAEFLHLTCNTSNCQLFLTTAISTWSVYQCSDSEDTLDCQVDSVVLQCSSVRNNQENLGILQKDHSQHVMYRKVLNMEYVHIACGRKYHSRG